MAENKSLQNFDWDAYEKESKGTLNEELIQKYDNTLSAIKDKEVVEGVVMSINKREVVVNVGFKSDGIVPATEFRYNPDLKVGDKVEVFIESQEDKKGQLVLSHKEARASQAWDRVVDACEKGEIRSRGIAVFHRKPSFRQIRKDRKSGSAKRRSAVPSVRDKTFADTVSTSRRFDPPKAAA